MNGAISDIVQLIIWFDGLDEKEQNDENNKEFLVKNTEKAFQGQVVGYEKSDNPRDIDKKEKAQKEVGVNNSAAPFGNLFTGLKNGKTLVADAVLDKVASNVQAIKGSVASELDQAKETAAAYKDNVVSKVASNVQAIKGSVASELDQAKETAAAYKDDIVDKVAINVQAIKGSVAAMDNELDVAVVSTDTNNKIDEVRDGQLL